MSPTATVELDTVSSWLDAGQTLDEIEHELLDPAPLSDEQRAVLWLYAWSQERRRDRIRATLRRRRSADPDA